VPATFQEHLKLLMDLQVIAFQADITRVSTLMFARELSTATYPETTIRDPFHNLSHHSNDRGNMDRFAQLNAYHMTKFAYFVEKLKGLPDGDGTLLDHSLVLYGSSLSDGNQHNFSPLPIVLAGHASGKVKGGRHLQFPKDTHMSNLLAAMLRHKGIPAYLVLLSTDHAGRFDKRVPSHLHFNHMIVAVRTEKGDLEFSDPTLAFGRPGLLSPGDADRDVLLLADGKAELAHTPPQDAGKLTFDFDLTLRPGDGSCFFIKSASISSNASIRPWINGPYRVNMVWR
jgi:hypothetical protein